MLEYNMIKKYIIDCIRNFLVFYTALNSFECSVFFKQINFNQFKFKILRIVNFYFSVLNFIH